MQDYLFVDFFLGHDAGDEARLVLDRCGLLETALADRANRNAWLGDIHFGAKVRLLRGDERLERLLAELHRRGIDPFTRVDRVYTDEDLARAEWLIVRIATAGLWGGADYGQQYDFTEACATCGAGCVPVAPLLAELNGMGKKDVDHLVYEGHLIISSRIARELVDFTGVQLSSVAARRTRAKNTQFKWLQIMRTLPRMHPSTSGYSTEVVCPTCGR